MKEELEIETINDLMHRGRTIAFDDFAGLTQLQADRDRAFDEGVIGEGVKWKLLFVMLERVFTGEADEVYEKHFKPLLPPDKPE